MEKDPALPSPTTIQWICHEGSIQSKLEALLRVQELRIPNSSLMMEVHHEDEIFFLLVSRAKVGVLIWVFEKQLIMMPHQLQRIFFLFLNDLQNLAKKFPETQSFSDSLSLSSFGSVMGDHTPSNPAAVGELSQMAGKVLQTFGCRAHKCDLVEEAFRKTLIKNLSSRVEQVVDDGSLDCGGGSDLSMKAPTGVKNIHSSSHFLYQLGKLALTSLNKCGHSEKFRVWAAQHDLVHHLTPLHSNRFLVYSYNSLACYQDLHHYEMFVRSCLPSSTWPI